MTFWPWLMRSQKGARRGGGVSVVRVVVGGCGGWSRFCSSRRCSGPRCLWVRVVLGDGGWLWGLVGVLLESWVFWA